MPNDRQRAMVFPYLHFLRISITQFLVCLNYWSIFISIRLQFGSNGIPNKAESREKKKGGRIRYERENR